MSAIKICAIVFGLGFLPVSARGALCSEASSPEHSLGEVTVTAQSARQRVDAAQLGSERLELDKLALAPQLLGERDIVKSITLLPGVHGEADGAGGFEVRGGNAYQNLVTVDGMTIFNPSHLMGIFSTFNDDAIGWGTLHKGPVPAEFGGASSSVLDVRMRDGDPLRYNFSGTIGLLNAKASASGPVVKDKLTFAVAARRSYFDLFLKCTDQYKGTVLNFYDVNAKIHYDMRPGSSLDASFFLARDNMAVSRLMSMNWGNIAGSLKWLATAGDSWRFTTTAAMTRYNTDAAMDIMDVDQRLKGYILTGSLNSKAMWRISDSHSVDMGFRSELLKVMTGEGFLNGLRTCDLHSGWQNALWVNYSGRFGMFSVVAGVRGTLFTTVTGDGFSEFSSPDESSPDFSHKTYFDIEPRLTLKADINECHNLKIGASVTTQHIHGIRTTSTSFPMDRYALSSASIKPERSRLLSAGYAGMTAGGAWDWSAEIYYRTIRNVYDYRDGMSMFSRIDITSIIAGGKGRGYGLELMLRKNLGRLKGWISYTLSKTETRIAGINGGRWYRAANDRRHNVNIVALYTLSDAWNLSAAWTYSSGHPLTAPDLKYEVGGLTAYYFSERNGYLTAPSHRLDLSANYTRIGRRFTSVLSFGIFNAYCHYSPFVVYFEDDPTKPSGTRAVQQSLFGIIPSISYTIKF